jgi:hypothetical protein
MKMSKPQIEKAHRIAKKIGKKGGAVNPYAVGTAVVKGTVKRHKKGGRHKPMIDYR